MKKIDFTMLAVGFGLVATAVAVPHLLAQPTTPTAFVAVSAEDHYVVFTAGLLDANPPPPAAFRVGTPGRYVFTAGWLDASPPPSLEGGLLGLGG